MRPDIPGDEEPVLAPPADVLRELGRGAGWLRYGRCAAVKAEVIDAVGDVPELLRRDAAAREVLGCSRKQTDHARCLAVEKRLRAPQSPRGQAVLPQRAHVDQSLRPQVPDLDHEASAPPARDEPSREYRAWMDR